MNPQQQQQQQAQPASSPSIWFRLVDAGGRAYDGSSTTSVLRASLPVLNVDQFRKAVKATCPITLQNVDPMQLNVFVGPTELAANQPLRASAAILDHHGATEDEPLLVMVPARNAARPVADDAGWLLAAIFGRGLQSFLSPPASSRTLVLEMTGPPESKPDLSPSPRSSLPDLSPCSPSANQIALSNADSLRKRRRNVNDSAPT